MIGKLDNLFILNYISGNGGGNLDDKVILKNRLKVARAEINISQEQLANLAGVSRQTISSIETGQYCPTAKLALILSKCLNKKFDELFYIEEEDNNV